MNIYIEILLVLLAFFFVVFLIGQVKKNNGLVDIAWGLGFVIVGVYSFFVSEFQSERAAVVTILAGLMGTSSSVLFIS